jgi:serine/threonine-protein kinase
MDLGDAETRLDSSPSGPVDVAGYAPGTILAQRYRIVALVGRGGMGEVYRADDLRLGQAVALKFLPVALEDDEVARERLLAEVRSARTVSHPNVCRVYDVGEVNGRYFLTMEYIDGEDLASLLRRIGRLPADKGLEIARQLCAGLAAAHERGVLHRDLKPANVMIDGRGQARITDFGLAIEMGAASGAGGAGGEAGAGRVAEVAGTVVYLAPERFSGAPATVQSDLYALGLVLYEIHTGRHALSATTLDGWRRAHTDSMPSDPSTFVADIDPAVERAILQCLEKDPAKRPPSARLLAAALPGGDLLEAAIAAGETPSPLLVANSGEEGTLPRAKAWRWFATCLVALAAAVPLGGLWHLENLVPLRAPMLQTDKARQALRDIGYKAAPGDSAWMYRVDGIYMDRLAHGVRPDALFTPPSTAFPGPFIFLYRESPHTLFSWNPYGLVGSIDPAPLFEDDAVVELDSTGRLLGLQVGTLVSRYDEGVAAPAPDWTPLFTAAGLDIQRFRTTAPKWPVVFGFDSNIGWDGEGYHVEAASYRGRPVEFRARRADMPVLTVAERLRLTPGFSSFGKGGGAAGVLGAFMAVVVLGTALLFSILASRNVRSGRGDRKGAQRIALAVFAAQAAYLVSYRHWTFLPINVVIVVTLMFGPAFFAGTAVFVYYLAVEPFIRRRSPQILIAWTRLLEGRWHDPLVGRSLLAGASAGLLAGAIVPGLATIATRATGLPLAFPWAYTQLHVGFWWFLTNPSTLVVGPVQALVAVIFLPIGLFAFRNERAAWALVLATTFGAELFFMTNSQPWLIAAPASLVAAAAVLAATFVFVLARHGLLACAVLATVQMALFNTPLTIHVKTSWYGWRTGVVVVLIGALAYWGFRNVIGRGLRLRLNA